MKKKDLINYILIFDRNYKKADLEKLSVEALTKIIMSIEVEMMQKN